VVVASVSCVSGARFIGKLVEYMSVYQNGFKQSEFRTDPAHLLLDGKMERTTSRGTVPWRERAKTTLDVVCALVLLMLTAPIVVLAALAVKLTSRGPIIYRQTRTGKDGKPYTIYKIRTMTHNCESQSGACWAAPGDPRITLVGRLLRRTHVDELPQLWNVVCGEMSLVGPRPERPEFVVRLEQAFPDYRKRLVLKPGLSGLAQIKLPPDTDLESVRRKLVYDLYYVNHRSFWLDIRIILTTVCKVFGIPTALPQMLLQLPTQNHVEGAGPVVAGDKGVLAPHGSPAYSSAS
jgi:lipopolysaccharide/colanic/teichoic acid biosynthesis glycosyltransferase